MEQRTGKLPAVAIQLLPKKPTAKARGALDCSVKLRGVPAMLWLWAASQHSQNSQLLPNFTFSVLFWVFFVGFFFSRQRQSPNLSARM